MLWLSSRRCPAGIEKANASAAGKHTSRWHILYTKLKSRLKRMSSAKKTHFENFGDFR